MKRKLKFREAKKRKQQRCRTYILIDGRHYQCNLIGSNHLGSHRVFLLEDAVLSQYRLQNITPGFVDAFNALTPIQVNELMGRMRESSERGAVAGK